MITKFKVLIQLVVSNVVGHLASLMLVDAWSKFSWVRGTNLDVKRFTKDSIHKCGEASLWFLTRFSLNNNKNDNMITSTYVQNVNHRLV